MFSFVQNRGFLSSDKDKLPAFWVPSLTPDDKGKLVKKPDTKVVCPMSKKSLKMKDLIPGKTCYQGQVVKNFSCHPLHYVYNLKYVNFPSK
jgi:hypothetical protein